MRGARWIGVLFLSGWGVSGCVQPDAPRLGKWQHVGQRIGIEFHDDRRFSLERAHDAWVERVNGRWSWERDGLIKMQVEGEQEALVRVRFSGEWMTFITATPHREVVDVFHRVDRYTWEN